MCTCTPTTNVKKKLRRNPLALDPTRTTTLRRNFQNSLRRKFNRLRKKINDLILIEDAFGLRKPLTNESENNDRFSDHHSTLVVNPLQLLHQFQVERKNLEGLGQRINGVSETGKRNPVPERVGRSNAKRSKTRGRERTQNRCYELSTTSATTITTNKRWQFNTTSEQVDNFEEWLKEEYSDLIPEPGDTDAFYEAFVQEGYLKGQGRAFNDVRKAGVSSDNVSDFFDGSREEFLRQSFSNPISIDRVKLLTGRVFTDLQGVGVAMAITMKRQLADGLVQGLSPFEVARNLNNTLTSIGRNRAEMIARTEIIRAHAEGQLDAMENLGVKEVGVMVEWRTTGDDRVCPLCIPLEGVVLKIAEARGMIPRHPNCRCSWVPANVGEDPKEKRIMQFADGPTTVSQKRGKAAVQEALDDSVRAGLPKSSKRTLAQEKARTRWAGADTKPTKTRPKHLLRGDVPPTPKTPPKPTPKATKRVPKKVPRKRLGPRIVTPRVPKVKTPKPIPRAKATPKTITPKASRLAIPKPVVDTQTDKLKKQLAKRQAKNKLLREQLADTKKKAAESNKKLKQVADKADKQKKEADKLRKQLKAEEAKRKAIIKAEEKRRADLIRTQKKEIKQAERVAQGPRSTFTKPKTSKPKTPIPNLRVSEPRKNETPSQYIDRMLGPVDSSERNLADSSTYQYYLQQWDASQK